MVVQQMSQLWCCHRRFLEELHMAASQNARSGSTPKTHRRSRPPIQTCDPDRSRPRSRPIQTSRSRPMIQTPLFYVGWTFSFSKYWKVLLCTTKYYSSTTLYYKVLLCTTKYDAGWSREFWKNLAIPFQTSFQTVPDPFQTSSMESKGSVHSQPCCPRRKNRSVRPVQNHLIQFKSYMKWLSWFQALRSRRAEKTFYESGRSRRPDHRGTIQTRLSTHPLVFCTRIFEGVERKYPRCSTHHPYSKVYESRSFALSRKKSNNISNCQCLPYAMTSLDLGRTHDVQTEEQLGWRMLQGDISSMKLWSSPYCRASNTYHDLGF